MALGYGQVPGVDVFNTFAPVVKSIECAITISISIYIQYAYIYTNWMYLVLSATHILTVMCICNRHLIIYYHVIIALSWRSLCTGYGALHAHGGSF